MARIRISRPRRAELARAAQQIRASGQRSGWPVSRIAAAILHELPQVLPLEAWRWAYGWSRSQVVEQVDRFHAAHRLGKPGLNASMLCRYEHGEITPSPTYAAALCDIYQAAPAQLQLLPSWHPLPITRSGYGAPTALATSENGRLRMTDNHASRLEALRESLALARESEGPAGGPQTIATLQAAIAYYDSTYSRWPAAVLADEVHQTRSIVGQMLRHNPADDLRIELLAGAGWLSALVGNLALHLSDHAAAQIHLATAARLGTVATDRRLTCWALAAQARVSYAQQHYSQALTLAQQAHSYADHPLQRAQVLAWGQLRALAHLSDGHTARHIARQAQDEMTTAGEGAPGRFGFDAAELLLHLAEATLLLGDYTASRRHATASQAETTVGRPSWAAATLVLARAEAGRGQPQDAVGLAYEVLDTVPPEGLRDTSRRRLAALDRDLNAIASTSVREFHDRIIALPALTPATSSSDEPNGT
ncbi:XRE family transcriptional regulator [Nonomuraea sp. NPDC050556]|uniref:XRE family transcriptional regulator n=1 Tax=Nonomuraea sp. NPDC050556 TaxID=3364369 RepID=UPI0037A521BB